MTTQIYFFKSFIGGGETMRNKEIRMAIRKSGLYNWQVASCIPLTDGNFSKWLRFEMDEEKKKKVYVAIEKAKKDFL